MYRDHAHVQEAPRDGDVRDTLEATDQRVRPGVTFPRHPRSEVICDALWRWACWMRSALVVATVWAMLAFLGAGGAVAQESPLQIRERQRAEAERQRAEAERRKRLAAESEIERLRREIEAIRIAPPATPVASAPRPSPAQPPAQASGLALETLDNRSGEEMKRLQAATAAAARLDVEFFDALRSGRRGPPMVVVPAGRYTIGAPGDERNAYVAAGARPEMADRERSQPVTVARAFAMSRHEVTRGEFGRFVRATNRNMAGGCWAWAGSEWNRDEKRSWQSPGFDQADEDPVVCVSWEDSQAYATWLSEQTGQRYRLASEAEWELAARAGTTGRRYWGDDDQLACAYENVADRDSGDSRKVAHWFDCRDGAVYTAAVGGKRPNALGLQDMLGNVSEWVADCFNESHATIPSDGSARVQCSDTRRVIRGGSWQNHQWEVRSAYRYMNAPANRNNNVGLRVVREL